MFEVPKQAKKRKMCKRCKMVFVGDDVDCAFRISEIGRTKARPICRFCEQDSRTAYAKKHVWMRKAKRVIRAHAEKLGISIKKLVEELGWADRRIAHEMEYSFGNGCTECGHLYAGMEGGRGALTIDHWDRRLDPVYGSNTRIMCRTCNQARGEMTPEEWIENKRLWRIRAIYLAKLAEKPKPEQMLMAI